MIPVEGKREEPICLIELFLKMRKVLEKYIGELYETHLSGSSTEGSFYPHIRELFESLGKLNGCSFNVLILPARTSAGYPDGKILDDAEAVGYFECKEIGADLNRISEIPQIQRYINSFENFILTNYLDFWFYRNGVLRERVKLLSYSDFARGTLSLAPSAVSEFEKLFSEFSSYRIPLITSAENLAEFLAKRTALLKEKLKLLLSQDRRFKGIYQVFRESFIKDMDEEKFCNTLAQALSYSLLIAKLYTPPAGSFKPENALTLIPRNLKLIKDFFTLLYTDIEDEEVENIIEDLAEVLSKFDPKLLFSRGLTLDDMITHFYEPFLKIYDPEEREIRGVYFTPSPVVRFIVKSVDTILREQFGVEDGLGSQNERVKVLDPAGGTLTFIIHALNTAIKNIKRKYGEGSVREWLDRYGTKNYFAFELLPSAYVIGHLRMSAFLKDFGVNKRFNLYLTNTLELEHEFPLYPTGLLRDMSEETKEADRVKRETPIMVIMGNPPYSGISANMKAELTRKLREDWDRCQSYYEVDRNPLHERKVWLQDDYVKFIRFGQWKIHKSGGGILAYITNHAYLDNPTFRGMRQSLLKTFDEIYILNLHGNARKKEPDENVFDIQQGTAIGIFVKNGSKSGEYADLYYADTLEMGMIKRREKYVFLRGNDISSVEWKRLKPESPFYFFVPREAVRRPPSKGEFKVNKIFNKGVTGIITARDRLVIWFTREELERKIADFLDRDRLSDNDIRELYDVRDNYAWKLKEERDKAIKEISKDDIPKYIKPILYRPFDIRYIFYHSRLVFRTRDEVMKHFLLGDNLGLVTHKREELKVGWSHILATKHLVEHGALSSKTTNYVFPLYLYHEDKLSNNNSKGLNFTKSFQEFLKANYPYLSAEDVFYYIYAVLYSESYRAAYEPELMYDFPSIPFFEEEVVNELIPLGKRLVELHTDWKNIAKPLGRFPISGNNIVDRRKVRYENGNLWINACQYFEDIPEEVWDYYIGGYQVLQKWLKERNGRPISPLEFMRITGTIKETIEIQERIDSILEFVC